MKFLSNANNIAAINPKSALAPKIIFVFGLTGFFSTIALSSTRLLDTVDALLIDVSACFSNKN